MITRPLDLSSHLRRPPRSFDVLFLVNGGLIALFFLLFGSRFVLSPGLRVSGAEFVFPGGQGAVPAATSVCVSVNASKQIFVDTGLVTLPRLKEWLVVQAKGAPGTTLLLIVDARVPTDIITNISEAATAAGFGGVHIAVQSAAAPEGAAP